MSSELLKSVMNSKFGNKDYDELTIEQKEFLRNYCEAITSIAKQIFSISPYKAKIPVETYGSYIDTDTVYLAPPKNYREEHDRFIASLVKGEKNG